MHPFRIAAGIAVIGSATVVVMSACSDPQPPTAVARTTAIADARALAAPLASAPGAGASVRRPEPDPRRRIPDDYLWIGEEHNRIMRVGIQEFQRAHGTDPALALHMRQDCQWTIALVDRELAPSMRRVNLPEGRGHQTMRDVGPVIRTAARCRGERVPTLSVWKLDRVLNLGARFAPAHSSDAYSAAAQAVIDRMVDRIGAAADQGEVFTAIADAAGEAALLEGLDQVAVYSAASLAQGSAELWSETTAAGGTLAGEAPYAMALFRSTATKTFGRFVQTDVKGCVAALPYLSKITADWRPMAAGCMLTGVVASLAYFLS